MAIDSIQAGVARGMAAAVGIVVGSFLLAYFGHWPELASQADLGSRLKLSALSAMLPTATLFLCIARLAKHRFTTPQDIGGNALSVGTERARLLQALLQNTLEQAVLAIPLYFAASIVFPPRLLPLVVCAASLFVVGRILFFRGYASGAPSRAVGFGLTFYPSVALFMLVVVLALLPGAG